MRPNDMPRPFAPDHSEGTTHGEGCHTWGPRHYECAMRELARLRAEVEGLREQHGRDSRELRELCAARDEARRERDELRRRIAEAPKGEVWQHACMGGQRTSNVVLTRDADDGLCPMGQRVALVLLDAEEGK